ncbi:MAG: branched-chain amino acid ABC transporter permease [Hyphomicrobiaceae bacterium]|nr:branched-chain amino acid ABC transporter permease [Hyphomicrobiaceae bacterium]
MSSDSPMHEIWGVAGLVAIALGLSLMLSDSYALKVVTWLSLNVLAAIALRFVMLVGELNIATAAFWGVGAYTAAIATVWLKLPFGVALVAGIVAPALLAVAFGFVTLRTKGPYFMLISFAFTEVLRLVYTQSDALGGNSGMIGVYPPRWLDGTYASLVVLLVGACLVGFLWLERSAFGKLMRAIENNDAVVASVGVPVLAIKIAALTIAAAAAGLGGGLFAHANRVISPGDFSFLVSVYALAYVKIGGEKHILGAVLGATFLTLLGQYVLSFGQYEHIYFGGAIVAAMLIFPEGMLGLLQRWGARLGLVRAPEPATSRGGH